MGTSIDWKKENITEGLMNYFVKFHYNQRDVSFWQYWCEGLFTLSTQANRDRKNKVCASNIFVYWEVKQVWNNWMIDYVVGLLEVRVCEGSWGWLVVAGGLGPDGPLGRPNKKVYTKFQTNKNGVKSKDRIPPPACTTEDAGEEEEEDACLAERLPCNKQTMRINIFKMYNSKCSTL